MPRKKVARKKVTSRKVTRRKVKKRLSLRSMLARSPEIEEVCRQLAVLALARQDGPLGVRQGEQLRRALTTAGEALGWTEPAAGDGDSAVEVGKDLMTMSKGGAKFMAHSCAPVEHAGSLRMGKTRGPCGARPGPRAEPRVDRPGRRCLRLERERAGTDRGRERDVSRHDHF